MSTFTHPGVELRAPLSAAHQEILTPEAVELLVKLHREFEPRRQERLQARQVVQRNLDAGGTLDFLPETQSVREAAWKVASIPPELADRRVEITGPVDRKMIINALNSGANVFMADFEDSNSPTWANNLDGQVNLRDACRGTLGFTSPEGKEYRLKEQHAVLLVRPRGWHLDEKHFLVDGQPISGGLFDFGLYFFHNCRHNGKYFYLPKLEHHLEARIWNDAFNLAQDHLAIPRGTIRATVLIETITAAFQMDEILHELKEHSAGLNCGRWDYIFSYIKRFRSRPEFLVPDRAQVTMEKHFLASYVQLLIKTCHRRGAHAMGGMAAQIPIKNDPEANQKALDKVRADKLREVKAGHDGTWVAHPGLIPIAREVFDEHMTTPNQLGVIPDVHITPADLLKVPEGTISEAGLRLNIDVGIQYLEAWLGGNGCVPIYNLMEDAATAEISRTQVWQWIRHGAKMTDGRQVTAELVQQVTGEEMNKNASSPHRQLAGKLFLAMMTSAEFPEFLTLVAYEHL